MARLTNVLKLKNKLETEWTSTKVSGKRRERVLMAQDSQKNNFQRTMTPRPRQMTE